MSLTKTNLANAKPKTKTYKMYDQKGLYIIISKSGGKSWKYDYRLAGVRRTYSIGSFPIVSLAEAREKHLEARKLVSQGIHPLDDKQSKRLSNELNSKRFSAYFNDWFNKQHYADSSKATMLYYVKKDLISSMDKKPIIEYSTMDLLTILLKMCDRGAMQPAIKMCFVLKKVFNEALLLGDVQINPATGLHELLPKVDPKTKSNFAHITKPSDLRTLLLLLDRQSDHQNILTTKALQLMLHIFLRPKNLISMKWQYVNTETRLITFPKYVMKTYREHVVPLSCQALEILESLDSLTGTKEHVFHSVQSESGHIAASTLVQAMKRLIANESFDMSIHGARHVASTMLHELGYDSDAIELQLGHADSNAIRGVYNKAQKIDVRIKMMQDYSNYLDGLKSNKNVIPFKKFG